MGAIEAIESVRFERHEALNSVTFSSIPQTYAHLQLRGSVKASGNSIYSEFRMRFNNDSSSVYTTGFIYSYGTYKAGHNNINVQGASTYGNASDNHNAWQPYRDCYASFTIDIMNYASEDMNKTYIYHSGTPVDFEGSAVDGRSVAIPYFIGIGGGQWKEKDAITSIFFRDASNGYWLYGSEFTLYGLKDS